MSATFPRVLWLYGLPGAGKSTLAGHIAAEWRSQGRQVVILDGDQLRSGLSSDLGFSDLQRTENIRRAAEMASLLCRQGFNVVAALITPLRRHREMVREILLDQPLDFHWVRCPLEVCMERDPNGIYSRAARGQLNNVTGYDSPFEEPDEAHPDLLPALFVVSQPCESRSGEHTS